MIKCKYCDSYLVNLPPNQLYKYKKELFCSNCNCSYYFIEGLVGIRFEFYANRYYFTIVHDYINNTTYIKGKYYPPVVIKDKEQAAEYKYKEPLKEKVFEQRFDSIVNINPHNAKDKVKLYMLFS